MLFEPFDEAARLGRRKGLVERGGLVGAEIILHEIRVSHDLSQALLRFFVSVSTVLQLLGIAGRPFVHEVRDSPIQ
jgi:hypothetical protein